MFYGMLSFSGVSFKPEKDIPDLAGKVIFITGGPPTLPLPKPALTNHRYRWSRPRDCPPTLQT